MSGRKPRSDSKLDSMPESRVLELRDRLLQNERYDDLLEWLALECGVSCSPSALTAFYRRHCAPVRKERRQLAVLKSEMLGDEMASDPAKWDEAIIEKVKQRVFEFLDSDQGKPMDLMLVVDAVTKANKDRRDDVSLELKERKQDLDERKVALMEAKARFADEVKKAAENRDGGVTAEEMEEIQRKLKLM